MASGETAPASSRATERRALAGGDMVRKNITIDTLLGIIAVLSLAPYRASTRTEAAAGEAAPQRTPQATATADRGDIMNTHLFRNIARRMAVGA
jgi:hypothetical protein